MQLWVLNDHDLKELTQLQNFEFAYCYIAYRVCIA